MIKPRRKPETAEETAKRLGVEENLKKEEAIKNMKNSLNKLRVLEEDVKNGTLSANRHFGTVEYWFGEAIMTDKGKFADRGWFIYLSEENKKEYIQKVIEIAESIGFNLEYYYTKSTGTFESVIKDMILKGLIKK